MKQHGHQQMGERKTNIWHTELNLQKARRKAGYNNAREFAKLVGIPFYRLSAIEVGQLAITMEEVGLIAVFLGVDQEYIKEGLRVTNYNRRLMRKRAQLVEK